MLIGSREGVSKRLAKVRRGGKIGSFFDQQMKGYLVLVATSEGRMSSSEVTFAYLPLTGSIWVAPKVVTFLFAPFSTRNVSRQLLEHLRIFSA